MTRIKKDSFPKEHPLQAWEAAIKELSDLKYALEVSAIVAVTKPSGEIVYVNDKYCEVTKYPRKEIIGRDHRLFNSKYHPPEFFKDLWTTILSGQVWRGVVRDLAKDGSLFWLDTTIVPLLTARKRPYQFICVRHEVTKLKEMEAEFATLPQKIIQAQEEERARISREIHDDLGQSLVTLKMMIQTHLHQGCTCANRKEMFRMVKYIDAIIAKTRILAAGLRPSTLEVLGLTSSLKTLIQDFRRTHGVKISARVIPLEGLKFKGEAINLYRVIQEALTNVISHARAKKVSVHLQKKEGALVVIIRDNGRGFPYGKKTARDNYSAGLGLSTMNERAKLLQGQIAIESSPGEGTVVKLTVPYS